VPSPAGTRSVSRGFGIRSWHALQACWTEAFSSRLFFAKAPQLWIEGSDSDHITDGAEETRAVDLNGPMGGKGNPLSP
jgi:hypothetical protein